MTPTLKFSIYLFIYKAVMYRDTKLVVLNFCTFDIFSIINEGAKNLSSQIWIQESVVQLESCDERIVAVDNKDHIPRRSVVRTH